MLDGGYELLRWRAGEVRSILVNLAIASLPRPQWARRDSAPGMVLALDMALELRAEEVDFAQVARAVPFGLIVEVRRCRMAAFASSRHGPGAHVSPNSTTATKLFPLVPYHFSVPEF